MLKKISYSGLKKVLSPKEMKNITGGGYTCTCDGINWFEGNYTSCMSALASAALLCGGDKSGPDCIC